MLNELLSDQGGNAHTPPTPASYAPNCYIPLSLYSSILSTHGTTSEPMVEVWRDDTFVASIYGHEEGVRLSKYFDGVVYDPDSPPAVVIKLSD